MSRGGRPTTIRQTITDIEVAPDAIKVTWGPTGNYTNILARIDDELGNHDQIELRNTPNGSHIFNGLRSGAPYRVILKGCSRTLLGDSCGPWSPNVMIATSLPPEELPLPGGVTLTVSGYTETTVVLDFSVKVARTNAADRFLVLRDGMQVDEVTPHAAPYGWAGSYTDPVQSRHHYVVCFQGNSPRHQVCSGVVQRPKVVSEQLPSEYQSKPLVILPGNDEGSVDYGGCPGCSR